ncbi:hypothetical protein ES703_108666 [subsurface metagenome]
MAAYRCPRSSLIFQKTFAIQSVYVFIRPHIELFNLLRYIFHKWHIPVVAAVVHKVRTCNYEGLVVNQTFQDFAGFTDCL